MERSSTAAVWPTYGDIPLPFIAQLRLADIVPYDLDHVLPSSGMLYFFYGTEMKGNWCALTNSENRLACAWQFDPEVFRCCWLFATYGGWRSYNVAVLEPCTGYPLNFEAMKAAGRHRSLAPGETLKTSVQFLVQEGLKSVGSVDASGKMSEAAD